jgi:hypothetical protein
MRDPNVLVRKVEELGEAGSTEHPAAAAPDGGHRGNVG